MTYEIDKLAEVSIARVLGMLGTAKCEVIGSSPLCMVTKPNDLDLLVLVMDSNPHVWASTNIPDAAMCADEEYDNMDGTWCAYREGFVNYIITNCAEFYENSMTAQRVVEALNLTEKDDRITVFNILRGYEYD